MTHSSASSSSSSSSSESEGHHKNSKKDKKKKDKKDKHKHKAKDKVKSKHGETSGLNALGVIQDVLKLGDHKHGGGSGHVPAAAVIHQLPHILGPSHNIMLPSHHHERNNTHAASSVRVSGHSTPSGSHRSDFSSSGHRVPLQAGDRLPSLHETGPAPFLDADGGPVFLGSALFQRSVHPCKIAPNVRDSMGVNIIIRAHTYHNNTVTPALPSTLRR